MLPGKKFNLEEIVRTLRRRWWIAVPPIVLGVAAGIFLAGRVALQYRSETLIMVVRQRIPDTYVKSMVTTNVEDRLPSIKEQILSRSRLERIIIDFDLYQTARARGIMEDVIQRMRDEDIRITLEGRESFRIAYKSTDPRTAQRVAERLASLTIEENLRERGNLAENANQFIESQLSDAKRRLLEHEKTLEAYRRRYSGQLPSQLPGNLQAIQNSQIQLQSLAESTNRARERRLEMERQIGDAQSLPIAAFPQGGAPAPLTAAQQLESARENLAAFKLRYTPDHPDIRALERTVKELQLKADEEAKRPAATAGRAVSPAEAARQQRIRDLQAQIEIVDRQIATNLADEARLRAIIADYQGKVEVLPTRESELVELTRDYSTLQETYAALLKKREDSQLAANLERRQVGEQFKILDPASMPERPFNADQRQNALFTSVFAGLFVGLAMVVLLEYRDSSFRREDDVLRVLSLPVLALVPLAISETDRESRRRRRRVAIGALALLLIIGCAAAVGYWQLQS